jgi:hypothetical protein
MPINYGSNNVSTSGLITANSGQFNILKTLSNGTFTDVSTVDHGHSSSEIITSLGETNLGVLDGIASAIAEGGYPSALTIIGAQPLLTDPVTGTGASNHVAYWNSSSSIAHDANQLVWDATNNRLGVGTSSPTHSLHVAGDVLATGSFIGGSGTAALPSFEFTGDPDTGLFSPAANTFGISTSGVERLRISNSGNVGIGTSTPSEALHVVGTSLLDNLHIAKRYTETVSAISISSNTLTVNLNTCNLFTCPLNANITTLTISNTPVTSGHAIGFTLIFTADGTARSVTWPSGVKWAGGTAPTLTSANTKRDVLSFLSTDNGTSYLGFVGGQNY